MLRVRAINKFHDKEGKLIGYTIQNEDNPSEVMNVHKDQLKKAVREGQCEVVNMTMTSDGRLIGRACKAPKPRAPKIRLAIKELYNIGKDILGGELIDTATNETRYFIGKDIQAMVEKGMLQRTGEEKKRTFKSIYNKVLTKIQSCLSEPIKITVTKAGKDLYTIDYEGDLQQCNQLDASLTSLLIMCIEFSMRVAKIKVVDIDGNTGKMVVNCLTGINDVRKALKEAGLHKI